MKITICIPTYKRNDYLHVALESISHQKVPSNCVLEVVISDNNPSNELPDKTHKVIKKNGFIYKKNTKNLGFEKNLLQLLKMSTGDVIFIMTDDDSLEDNAITTIFKAFENNNISYLFSTLKIQNDRGFVRNEKVFPSTKLINPKQTQEVSKLFKHSYILTGICVKKKDLQIEGCEKFFYTGAPQMWLVGNIITKKNGMYIDEIISRHTIGNVVHWSTDDNYLIKKMYTIIDELHTTHLLNQSLKGEIVKGIPYLLYVNLHNPKIIATFLRSLHREKMLFTPHTLKYSVIGAKELVYKKLANILFKSNYF